MSSKISVEDILTEIGDLAKKVANPDYQFGIKKLRAFRDLALSRLPFSEGDRVAIADSWGGPTAGGWFPHREWMRPGQTGIVREIDISPDTLRLHAVTMFDTEWEVSEWPTGTDRRYNHLFDYDGVTPKDRRHVFYFPAEHLRSVTDTDKPFQCPVGASLPDLNREAE